MLGYPALSDEGETVSLKVFDAREGSGKGPTRRLAPPVHAPVQRPGEVFRQNVPGLTQMAMQYMALGSAEDLKRQLVELTFERACLAEPLPTGPAAFQGPLPPRPRPAWV